MKRALVLAVRPAVGLSFLRMFLRLLKSEAYPDFFMQSRANKLPFWMVGKIK